MPKGPLVYRQRLITRITHWIWAVSLLFLMLTGLQIFNAFPSLHIGQESGFDYDNAIFAIGARQEGEALRGVTRVPKGARVGAVGWKWLKARSMDQPSNSAQSV